MLRYQSTTLTERLKLYELTQVTTKLYQHDYTPQHNTINNIGHIVLLTNMTAILNCTMQMMLH